MFAQLTGADPVVVRDFLIITGFLLSSAAAGASLFMSRKTQKREVSFGTEHVTKDMCRGQHAGVDIRLGKTERELVEMRAEVKEDRDKAMEDLLHQVGKVHDRVNVVLQAVSELKGRITKT